MDGIYKEMMNNLYKEICGKDAGILPDLSEIENKTDKVCPVDWAYKVADLARKESCGRCLLCREGSIQLYLLLGDIIHGKGDPEDLPLVEEICSVMTDNSVCLMARTAAGLVSASLNRYREEWEIHLKRRRCTALVCRDYFTVHILPEACRGCGLCARECPEGAILGGPEMIHVVDPSKCTRCGICLEVCPHNAPVKAGAVPPKTPENPVPVGSFEAAAGRRRRRGSGD